VAKKRGLIIDIINNFTHLVIIYGLFATAVYIITGSVMQLLLLWVMIVPFGVNFVLRRKVNVLGVLVLVHMIMPILFIFLLPFTPLGITWMVLLVGLALHSIACSFAKKPTVSISFSIPWAMVFTVFAMWAASADVWTLVVLYPIVIGVAVIGRKILIYMIQLDMSLSVPHLSSTQPLEKITSFNYRLVAGLAVVIAVMAVPIYLFVLVPFVNLIMRIFPGLPEMTPGAAEVPDPRGVYATPPVAIPPWLMEEVEPSLLQQVIIWILNIALGAILIVIAGAVLYVLASIILRLVNLKIRKSEAHLNLAGIEDEREFIIPKLLGAKRRRRVKGSEHPVRRMFRETVVRHIKKGVPIVKSDTPADMADRIQEDISQLAEDYEKVRYGN